MLTPSIHISIWGSGSGTNAQALIDYFRNHAFIQIRLIVSDHAESGILTRAQNEGIDCRVLTESERRNPDFLLELMDNYKIHLIVLAGYMRKVNPQFLSKFKGQVLNIHPALLPAYGGKGMYGSIVHEAVIHNQEKISGITIHQVNGAYDEGPVLFQKSLEIQSDWDAVKLANEILKLEHRYYPEIVERECKKIYSAH